MRSIVGIALTLLLAGAPLASAQMMGGGGSMGGDMMGEMHGAGSAAGSSGSTGEPIAFGYDGPWISFTLAHAKELDLSAEQTTALSALREDFQKEALRLDSEIRGAEAEARRLYAQQPLDFRALESKLRAGAGLEADLELARLKTLAKGKALLTSEQQRKLATIAESMKWSHGASMMGRPSR